MDSLQARQFPVRAKENPPHKVGTRSASKESLSLAARGTADPSSALPRLFALLGPGASLQETPGAFSAAGGPEGISLEHRNVEYTVAEEQPRRWRWKIHLSPTTATVISEARFPTREAAVAACLEEINNGLERSRHIREASEAAGGDARSVQGGRDG